MCLEEFQHRAASREHDDTAVARLRNALGCHGLLPRWVVGGVQAGGTVTYLPAQPANPPVCHDLFVLPHRHDAYVPACLVVFQSVALSWVRLSRVCLVVGETALAGGRGENRGVAGLPEHVDRSKS